VLYRVTIAQSGMLADLSREMDRGRSKVSLSRASVKTTLSFADELV
jgi:hypothetical protein